MLTFQVLIEFSCFLMRLAFFLYLCFLSTSREDLSKIESWLVSGDLGRKIQFVRFRASALCAVPAVQVTLFLSVLSF